MAWPAASLNVQAQQLGFIIIVMRWVERRQLPHVPPTARERALCLCRCRHAELAAEQGA